MPQFISLSQAANRLGVPPKVLCDLIWLQEIDVERCPLVGRTRCIPRDYLPEIRRLLIKRGKLRDTKSATPKRRRSPTAR